MELRVTPSNHRVHVIGKCVFEFWNRDFRFALKRENIQKWTSTLRMLSLDFPSFHFLFGEIWKRVWKTVLKNSSFACACMFSRKKTTVHDNSFANPFSDFKNHSKKGNPCIWDLDVISDIHLSSAWGRISQGWYLNTAVMTFLID